MPATAPLLLILIPVTETLVFNEFTTPALYLKDAEAVKFEGVPPVECKWPGSVIVWLCCPTDLFSKLVRAVPAVPASVPAEGSPTKYRPCAAASAVHPEGQEARLKNITAPAGVPPLAAVICVVLSGNLKPPVEE